MKVYNPMMIKATRDHNLWTEESSLSILPFQSINLNLRKTPETKMEPRMKGKHILK
jgi:hypothetical protein